MGASWIARYTWPARAFRTLKSALAIIAEENDLDLRSGKHVLPYLPPQIEPKVRVDQIYLPRVFVPINRGAGPKLARKGRQVFECRCYLMFLGNLIRQQVVQLLAQFIIRDECLWPSCCQGQQNRLIDISSSSAL